MGHRVLLFGITKEILQTDFITLEKSCKDTEELTNFLLDQYPPLRTISSFQIAVNHTYVSRKLPLNGTEEIALIPPVSGG